MNIVAVIMKIEHTRATYTKERVKASRKKYEEDCLNAMHRLEEEKSTAKGVIIFFNGHADVVGGTKLLPGSMDYQYQVDKEPQHNGPTHWCDG